MNHLEKIRTRFDHGQLVVGRQKIKGVLVVVMGDGRKKGRKVGLASILKFHIFLKTL